MSDLERVFVVRPAYDCIGVQPCVHGSLNCKPGTGGSHGRHNAEMNFTVRGPDAEITLVIGTGWDLPTVPKHHRIRKLLECPSGRFVEMHTAHPRFEGQAGNEPGGDGTCKDWTGCYISTGYRMAEEPALLLVEKGSDAVWEWLETLYAETQSEMAAVRAAGEANS
jgi:hypothetical protein